MLIKLIGPVDGSLSVIMLRYIINDNNIVRKNEILSQENSGRMNTNTFRRHRKAKGEIKFIS